MKYLEFESTLEISTKHQKLLSLIWNECSTMMSILKNNTQHLPSQKDVVKSQFIEII